MVTKAEALWEKVYTNRTNMLWSKEEYLSSMHTYKMLTNKMEITELKKKKEEQKLKTNEYDEEIIRQIEANEIILTNLQDGVERAKQNSKAAENTYKRTLDNMNSSVDDFHSEFKPILNKIQDSDQDQIEFMKINL